MKRKPRSDLAAYRRQAEICKALANPLRLHLVDLLSRKERWCTELQVELGISKANLSQHLALLKSAGIVSASRVGKQLYCSLSRPEVKQASRLLRRIMKSQARETRRLG
jgi:DNA-binding transcriptional ArsR family regulator